jgi:hypothetical protein
MLIFVQIYQCVCVETKRKSIFISFACVLRNIQKILLFNLHHISQCFSFNKREPLFSSVQLSGSLLVVLWSDDATVRPSYTHLLQGVRPPSVGTMVPEQMLWYLELQPPVTLVLRGQTTKERSGACHSETRVLWSKELQPHHPPML